MDTKGDKMLYSKTTKGFYNTDINTIIPSDAVEISDELYESLMNGQSTGKIIQQDSSGNPILVDTPEHILIYPPKPV